MCYYEKFNLDFKKDIHFDDLSDKLKKQLQMKEPIGMPIEGGKSYTVSGARGVVFFDAEGNILGKIKNKKMEFTFDTPKDCRYFRYLIENNLIK